MCMVMYVHGHTCALACIHADLDEASAPPPRFSLILCPLTSGFEVLYSN